MTGPFKVGEVCIGQNYVRDTYRNGQECVVTESLHAGVYVDVVDGQPCFVVGYMVRWADGDEWMCEPEKIRRKRPPVGELSIIRMFDVPVAAPKLREVEAA